MIRSRNTVLICTAIAASLAQFGCRHNKHCSGAEAPPAAAAAAPAAAPAAVPAAAAAPAPLTSEQLAKWYGDCWQLFNDKKWDEFSKCYSDDAIASRGSMAPDLFKGRTQIVEMDAKSITAAFPDIKGERQLTLVNGNHIAAVALLTGTHTGPLNLGMGDPIPATNKKMGLMMVHSIEVNASGQATKQWEVDDTPTMMAQLGLSKAPARAAMTKLASEPMIVLAKNDEAEAKNVAAHKKAYEQMDKKDPALFDGMTDGVVEHDYSAPADLMGKKTLTAKLSGLQKAFSDMHCTMDEVWGAGDYTFVRGRMTGTNDGDLPMMKIKKTGKKVDMVFSEIAQWENGKVKTVYWFMDGMEMAGQLGLLPPPPAAKPAAAPVAAKPAAAPVAAKPAAAPAPAAAAPAAKPAAAPAPAAAAPAKK